MSKLFPQLRANQQRGSKPRCHLLTHGTRDQVAARLTALAMPWCEISPSDSWMPEGFMDCQEPQLHSADSLLPKITREALLNWWLAAPQPASTTPNFDIASTCTIRGKQGLLLIEAKAHNVELIKEEQGKQLRYVHGDPPSANSRLNHESVGSAIDHASTVFSGETRLSWALQRDSHYQMANRFAWAQKTAEMGFPVILMYLGFMGCEEMREGRQQRPIVDHQDWTEMVKIHSRPLFPFEVWNQQWNVCGQDLVAIIRSCVQPLTF